MDLDTILSDNYTRGESFHSYQIIMVRDDVLRRKKEASPTIRDVAKLAGVSPATVSGVLGGTKSVSAITRQRVEQAIAELGYRPNAVARALRTNTSRTIGFVVPDITNPFYADIAKGVTVRAREFGYGVFLTVADESFEGVTGTAGLLADRRVDGMVFTNVGLDYKMPLRTIEGVPYVLVNRYPEILTADYIGIDNFQGAIDVTEHLLRLGHRRIGFIGGMENSSASKARLDGFRSALNKFGLSWDQNLVAFGHLDYSEAVDIVRELASQGVTAIFAGDDMMALGALEGLTRQGLRVPTDISVVGFDGIWPTALPGINLTTVTQPRIEIGMQAVNLLLDRIQGFDGEPRIQKLPHKLAVRGTTDVPRRSNLPNLEEV